MERNITSVDLREMAAILESVAQQVQQFEPNVSCLSRRLCRGGRARRKRLVAVFLRRPPILIRSFVRARFAGGPNAPGQRVRPDQIAELPIDDDAGGGAPIEPGGRQFGGARPLQSVESVRGH